MEGAHVSGGRMRAPMSISRSRTCSRGGGGYGGGTCLWWQDACTDEHLALTHLQWERAGEGKCWAAGDGGTRTPVSVEMKGVYGVTRGRLD